MTRKTLIEDAERMEDAAIDLVTAHRYSIGKIVYWLCVAVLHLIEWVVTHEGGANRR